MPKTRKPPARRHRSATAKTGARNRKKKTARTKKTTKHASGKGLKGRGSARAPAPSSPHRRGPELLTGTDGIAAHVTVVESVGGRHDVSEQAWRRSLHPSKVGRSTGGKGGALRLSEATFLALAAAGHARRGTILLKLLEGPATYQALKKVTKLLPGPLYHHIHQLRIARLILPKQRDLYELTRAGRNLTLMLLAAEPLLKDARRRPMPAS